MAVNKLEIAQTRAPDQDMQLIEAVGGGIVAGGDAMPAGSFVALVWDDGEDPQDVYDGAEKLYLAFVAASGGSRP